MTTINTSLLTPIFTKKAYFKPNDRKADDIVSTPHIRKESG